jgi:hypothetical protein
MTSSFGYGSTPQPGAPPLPSITSGTFGFVGNSVSTPNPLSSFTVVNPSLAATPSYMGLQQPQVENSAFASEEPLRKLQLAGGLLMQNALLAQDDGPSEDERSI